jgi:outer membrane receptor for Fe3+-dicitrate
VLLWEGYKYKTADNKKVERSVLLLENNDYFKYKSHLFHGKMANGLSASVLFSQTRGDGYVDGTQFRAKNYFIGLGYELNSKNSFQFVWYLNGMIKKLLTSLLNYLRYGAMVSQMKAK